MQYSIGEAITPPSEDGTREIHRVLSVKDGTVFQTQLAGTIDKAGQTVMAIKPDLQPITKLVRTQLDRIELKQSYGYKAPIGTGIDYPREFGIRSVFDIYSINPDGSYQAQYIGSILAEDGRFRVHSGILSPNEPSWEPICESPADMFEIIALHPGVINRKPIGHAFGHENDEGDVSTCYDVVAVSPSGGRVTVRCTGYLDTGDGEFVDEDHHAEQADYTRAFTHIRFSHKATRLLPIGIALSDFRPGAFPDIPGHRDVYEVFTTGGGITFDVAHIGRLTDDGTFNQKDDREPMPVYPLTIDQFEIVAIGV